MKWLLFLLAIATLMFGQWILAVILFVGACVIEAMQPKKAAKSYDLIGWLLNAMFGHGERYPPRDDRPDRP